MTIEVFLPCFLDGTIAIYQYTLYTAIVKYLHALEYTRNRSSDGEEGNDGEEEVDCISVVSLRHDSKIQKQDGCFVEGDGHLVSDLENPMKNQTNLKVLSRDIYLVATPSVGKCCVVLAWFK